MVCEAGAQCNIHCESGAPCAVRCEAGSTCDVDCEDGTTECEVWCDDCTLTLPRCEGGSWARCPDATDPDQHWVCRARC